MSSFRRKARRLLWRGGILACAAAVLFVVYIAITAALGTNFFEAIGVQKKPAFTVYAPVNSQPRFTKAGRAAVEIMVAPYITMRESQVLEGQEATVAPPNRCNIRLLDKVMRGASSQNNLRDSSSTSDSPPFCGKVGFNKDKNPIYQQLGESDQHEVYYYTRLGKTHIVLVMPLDYAAEPANNALAQVVSIVDSLQPFDGGKVQSAP